jgi:peptide/nickel transport system substrate-binding protein
MEQMLVNSARWGRLKITAALAVVMLGAAACGGGSGSDAAAGTDVDGGTLTAAVYSEMASYDPVKVTYPGAGLERAVAVMGSLMSIDDRTGEVYPYMAQSFESGDGKTWTLKLRDGVTFTDGEPFDAEAVKFNLERHVAADSVSVAKQYLTGMTLTVVDASTLEIISPTPDGSLPITMAGTAGVIGSPKALQDPKTFGNAPVGAGPFVLTKWARDNETVMDANRGYWDAGKPYLDKVVWRPLPDTDARSNAMLSGDLNFSPVERTAIPQLDNGAITVFDKEVVGGVALFLNNDRGPTKDKRVREALWKAFDPKVTAKVLYNGEWDGNLECLPFATSSPDCLKGVYPKYDEEGAKKLVAEYLADGGDPNVTLTVISGYVGTDYYLDRLNSIGLKATSDSVDVSTLATKTVAGDFDIQVNGTAQGPFPAYWNRLNSKSPNNAYRTTVPGLDEKLAEVRAAIDPEVRTAAWQDVQQIVADESLLLWVSAYNPVYATQKAHFVGAGGSDYKGSSLIYLDSTKLQG